MQYFLIMEINRSLLHFYVYDLVCKSYNSTNYYSKVKNICSESITHKLTSHNSSIRSPSIAYEDLYIHHLQGLTDIEDLLV
jgi:hypothetical protein